MQTVFKQFGGSGHGGSVADDVEYQLHQRLEKLYISTRTAKVRLRSPLLILSLLRFS